MEESRSQPLCRTATWCLPPGEGMEEQDELEFVGSPEHASSGHPESTGEIAPVFTDDESDTYSMNDSDRYH